MLPHQWHRNCHVRARSDRSVLVPYEPTMVEPYLGRAGDHLAPEAIVVYGSIHAPWEMFVIAAKVVAQHYSTCCSIPLRHITLQHLRGFEFFYNNVLQLELTREKYRSKDPMPSFCQLLQQFRARKATDPRDMVYALFGFATDINAELGFSPDYLISKREVYEKITVLCM